MFLRDKKEKQDEENKMKGCGHDEYDEKIKDANTDLKTEWYNIQIFLITLLRKLLISFTIKSKKQV